MSSKPRQRSEISLSLASVLVISVKMRRFFLKVAASASAACRRVSRIGVLQAVQRRLQRQLLAVDVEAQVGHRLVEQAVPGAAPGDRLFVEQLLDAVLELVGLVHPEVEHPGPVVAEAGVGVERGVDQRIVDQVEFQRKEQQMRAGVGHLLLDVAIELGALRVGRVAGIDEAGIGDDAADQLLQRLVFAKALAKPGLAALGGLSRASLPFQRVSKATESAAACSRSRVSSGASMARIKIGEVPFRQIAERGRALTASPAWPSGSRGVGHIRLPRIRWEAGCGCRKKSFTGFLEALFRTLCQDDPDDNHPTSAISR